MREKYSWQRYLLDALPERRTMTMHHKISARRSLVPAGDSSKLFSDTLSPTRQWGREKSAPRPYETDPFRRHLSSTLLDFKLRFSHLFISQCSHRVFHVVHSEVWACARAKTDIIERVSIACTWNANSKNDQDFLANFHICRLPFLRENRLFRVCRLREN